MLKIKKALAAELLAEVLADRYDVSASGVYFPRQSVNIAGTYRSTDASGKSVDSHNRVTKEGLLHLLNVSLGKAPKPAQYYIALFSGSAAPADNWQAANFAAVASEIVSLSEGYTLATRIPCDYENASTDTHIDNYGREVEVTFATAASINVTGAALLTASGKGATTGTLVSASLYPAPYTFMNGNTFKVGYRVEMTV
ncbi:hypothetical protein LZ683_08970 [Comamonas testosteroni]|uniref:hypothetical protein n=1 Tax=Comamonas testosteroni TaxID=285 RepID=UPI0023AA9695|nr:hypothetical protein [Comamonas testosteroni]WEE79473.1 hypothetical protein LZ683_08970 [Comamonas testosteroni]